jgi:hypothetical protein
MIVLVLLALGYGVAARASDWQSVTSTPAETVWMDMASIHRDNGAVMAWVKQFFTDKKKTPKGHEYQSSRSLFAFRCDSHQVTWLDVTAYSDANAEGTVVDTDTIGMGLAHWTYVAPDTIAEALMQAACKQAAQPK